MKFEVKQYSTVNDLSKDIKCALNSHINKVMFHLLSKKLTCEELTQYLGKTLDNDKNRELAFVNGSLCKTMLGIFKQKKTGGTRRKLFIDLLLEYDRETYSTLLANMIE